MREPDKFPKDFQSVHSCTCCISADVMQHTFIHQIYPTTARSKNEKGEKRIHKECSLCYFTPPHPIAPSGRAIIIFSISSFFLSFLSERRELKRNSKQKKKLREERSFPVRIYSTITQHNIIPQQVKNCLQGCRGPHIPGVPTHNNHPSGRGDV